jgi:glyoxylase-like metal-dependent hydrolase (beta-lactamase superfamily II)
MCKFCRRARRVPLPFGPGPPGAQLLRNTRKTERGAGQFLTFLEVRAAPFALLRDITARFGLRWLIAPKRQRVSWNKIFAVFVLAVASLAARGQAAHRAPNPPKSPRLYIFDCGVLKPADAKEYGFEKEQIAVLDMSVPCFLVAHPKGTLLWDAGVIPDSDFKADGAPVTQGMSTVTRRLRPQLAAIGYHPEDIQYIAFSHYHFDHTANANMFSASTWLVAQAERDIMFSDRQAPGSRAKHYSALKDSKTTILPAASDYDVFGDGTVIVKPAPGHTPGHQVLFLKLHKTGPVLIAGDLYHYNEERNTDRVPTFEYNKEQSLASRAKIEEFLKASGAQLWIEHDYAANAKLKKAPAYYD